MIAIHGTAKHLSNISGVRLETAISGELKFNGVLKAIGRLFINIIHSWMNRQNLLNDRTRLPTDTDNNGFTCFSKDSTMPPR